MTQNQAPRESELPPAGRPTEGDAMARTCRRGKAVQRKRAGLTAFQRTVLAEAEPLGLYVAFEAPWRLFALDTGQVLGWFSYTSMRFKVHDQTRTASGGWRQMLREVAELNRSVATNGAEVGDAELLRVPCKE